MNVNDLLKEIIKRTHFYDKIYKIGDYANVNVRISSIESITKSMVNLGMSIDEFRDYLETIIKDNYEIKYFSSFFRVIDYLHAVFPEANLSYYDSMEEVENQVALAYQEKDENYFLYIHRFSDNVSALSPNNEQEAA